MSECSSISWQLTIKFINIYYVRIYFIPFVTCVSAVLEEAFFMNNAKLIQQSNELKFLVWSITSHELKNEHEQGWMLLKK